MAPGTCSQVSGACFNWACQLWNGLVISSTKVEVCQARWFGATCQGMTPEQARAQTRKVHPFFGDPDDTSVASGEDRPVPVELKVESIDSSQGALAKWKTLNYSVIDSRREGPGRPTGRIWSSSHAMQRDGTRMQKVGKTRDEDIQERDGDIQIHGLSGESGYQLAEEEILPRLPIGQDQRRTKNANDDGRGRHQSVLAGTPRQPLAGG